MKLTRCSFLGVPVVAVATLLSACGVEESAQVEPVGVLRAATTNDFNFYWQPFARNSVWNLRLAANRSETPMPANARNSGAMALSDADYGIKVYAARTTDPTWQTNYTGFSSFSGQLSWPRPYGLKGPSGMTPPTGTDGTVVVIDPDRRWGYEMWQWRRTGTNAATASYVEHIDLASSGLFRNVGVTASGLPGIGGLLKTYETSHNVEIRHKLWAAIHPNALYARAVWPAVAYDVSGNGSAAFFSYGDVLAITKNVNVDTICNLSPFMKRIAHALQDYGAIVQDRGGDSVGIVSEVDSVRNYIDVDYNSTMWTMLECMEQYLVKVNDPWTGATPGGLGYDAPVDSTPPTTPPSLVANPASSSQVTLDWGDSTDNIGVAGYHVFRNSTQVASSPSSAFVDSGLQPSTRYTYFVKAYDAAGNISASSTQVAATTPGGGGGNPELLTNPGFESGATWWSFQKWTGNPSVGVCTNRYRSGSKSFCITNGANQDGAAVSGYVPVTGGVRYNLNAWLSLENISSGEALLMVGWVDAAGTYLGTVESTGKSANASGFVQETLSVTAPSNAAQALIFLFSYARGKVYYDDVSFKRQ